MNAFNYSIRYHTTLHAQKRAVQRTGCLPSQANQVVKDLAKNGSLLLEVGRHRYLKSGDFFLPCIEHQDSNDHNIYVIKSVLKWDMVKHRLQRIIDKYR